MMNDLSPIFFENVTSEHVKLRSWNQKIKKNEYKYATTDMLANIEKRYGLENLHIQIDYTFAAKPFAFFFKSFVDKFYDLKKNAKNITEKQLAKLLLNSAFGKFGSKMHVYKKYYDINTQDFLMEEDTQRGYFLPMAIAITSTARSYMQSQLDGR